MLAAVENQTTSKVIATTERKQKIASIRNEKVNHKETSGNQGKCQNGDQVTTDKRAERVANCRETEEGWRRGANAGICIQDPQLRVDRQHRKADIRLVTQVWVGDKPCLVTVDTGAYVTVARPDITARWPESLPIPGFTLQIVPGVSLPILKEVLLTLILGRRPLRMWVFVADTTDGFILGLDIIRAYDTSLDIGRHTLRLADEEVSLWSPGERPRPSSFIVAKDYVISHSVRE
jgi:hypothetical protein